MPTPLLGSLGILVLTVATLTLRYSSSGTPRSWREPQRDRHPLSTELHILCARAAASIDRWSDTAKGV